MARNPAPSPTPSPALPSTGGAYELVGGKICPEPQPEDAAAATPETPSEKGA